MDVYPHRDAQKRTPNPWLCRPAGGPGDLGVEDVPAVGLGVSDGINNGTHVHLLAPIYRAYPKVDA